MAKRAAIKKSLIFPSIKSGSSNVYQKLELPPSAPYGSGREIKIPPEMNRRICIRRCHPWWRIWFRNATISLRLNWSFSLSIKVANSSCVGGVSGTASHLMPNMQGAAAAAVDGVMRAAINKRTDDVGLQSGSRVSKCSLRHDEKLSNFKVWKGGRVV